MQVNRGGRDWGVGAAADVSWIAGHTTAGISITTAMPAVFDAYATTYQTDQVTAAAYEHALIEHLTAHTPDQPWWLAYLDTGAHDVVLPHAPRVFLHWNWPYILVETGPEQALTWRTGGHIRHPHGALPDLFFPADRSWLVSALWDDTWTCVGGPTPVIHTLQRGPVANARQVQPDEDALPRGLTRE
ncbi:MULTISPECIES: hypothetical protein [unclassified Micromonospora]|uniref:hypothetical protein n=1 Tax=unclassified Micromonospora TaxID=2617518 RepID=UPI001B35D7F4|nr:MULTISPECIES: hypothetical protein [unclassified Micromonospora]MBQ1044160.1 hypothetical protein [Micromonospora sp. C72]MBQ1058312.1 hypothetical protein [Micromonospora sp. C32]